LHEALRPRREDAIPHKVFVGNLNFQTTQSELETIFSEVGEVQEVFIPVDRASGRPRGFAFVEFTDAEGVEQAIEKLDGKEIGGRAIRVNEAQERAPRPPMGPRGGGGGSFDPGRIPPAKPKGSRRNIRGKKRSL
jgi:RNA recognition motif-containing protein